VPLRPSVVVGPDNGQWLARSPWSTAGIQVSDRTGPVQFLHVDDLVSAVNLLRTSGPDGAVNVAPDGWLTASQVSALKGPAPRVRLSRSLAVLIAGVGIIDDLRDVSAPAKLAGMVVAASVLVISGISILVFRVPFAGVFVLSTDWSYLLSVLWVVGMANAINLIDGLDGLAGGIVAIAAGTFFLYAHQLGGEGLLAVGNIGPLIAIVVLGACIGFLPHNIHPAKIFMGDGGALLLGLLMAASTMVVGGRTDRSFSGSSFFFFAPLFIPLVILGVPVIDTLFAIIRRARHRSGISTADKGHLHHRLMDLGHGHRRSVFILWTWTALLSGFVLWPIYSRSGDGLVPFGIAAILLSLFTVLHPGVRTGRGQSTASTADPDD
jgi:UDP-GlcNAc:undecaprenyl-phosphate GlcNAc-1-phosphate transferase